MAGLTFGYIIAGEAQLLRRIDNISEMADDLSPLWEQLVDEFHESERQTFAAEGAFEGKLQWDKLSERYEKWKRRKYRDQPILVAEGKLRKSLTSRDAEGSHVKIEPRSMEVGTTYRVGRWNLALIHQLGTRFMVPREPVRFSKEQKKRWSRLVVNSFKRRITEITKSGEEKTFTKGSGILGIIDVRREK